MTYSIIARDPRNGELGVELLRRLPPEMGPAAPAVLARLQAR